jgi:hypothetical protein
MERKGRVWKGRRKRRIRARGERKEMSLKEEGERRARCRMYTRDEQARQMGRKT